MQGLIKIGIAVGNGLEVGLNHIATGLQRKGIDTPGLTQVAQAVEKNGGACDIAQTETRHTVALGHGVENQEVMTIGHLVRLQDGLTSETLIGLVNDVDILRMMADDIADKGL